MRRTKARVLVVVLIAIAVTAAAVLTLVLVSRGPRPAQAGTRRVLYYRDAMNPEYHSPRPGKAPDGMDLVPVYEDEDTASGLRVSPGMLQASGVLTETAAVRALVRDIRASATVMPDERRVYLVTARTMGYAERLDVNYTGQSVSQGQPLFEFYSPDLVAAQTEYLQAYQDSAGVGSGELRQSARQRLLNWGFDGKQVSALEQRGAPEHAVTIHSPAAGTVTEKMISAGQTVDPGMMLYKIVDFSRVWVVGAIYQQDIGLVRVGQKADVELDYYPGERFTGTLTYVAPEMDMDSRTLAVRLELANSPDIKVKPGMNATITIHAALNRRAVTVPEQAVIRTGLRTLVVIARPGGRFEPRAIVAGQTAEGYTEVVLGVQAGEAVVVSAQFLIDSESNLRAALMQMSGSPESIPSATSSSEARPAKSPAAAAGSMDNMPGMAPVQPSPAPPKRDTAPPDSSGGTEDMPGMKGM
jgi:multidrug efflux pump subunit AcrA (membrane-fusion protein)